MEKKDFFVSYNKTNNDWAKWVAGTLEENGYSVYLQAWDIAPGDDFIARMNEFLQHSENYLAVLSSAFWQSEYCKKEFQTAFNAHLNGAIKKFLPVRVEDFTPAPLYDTTVYIDLFQASEEDVAAKVLLNAVGNTSNPRKKGTFPNLALGLTKQISSEDDGKYESKSFSSRTNSDNFSVEANESVRSLLLLGASQNKKVDLFNHLIHHVFHSLGFGDPSYYNIFTV